ncbi:flagellin [Methanosalsum zhilinae DSM 4017]|uniref:Flagellin n=1 Tax=Methanosalsum zhilinae (strain DSM 4017 / NBRC 107636 / OCM 62 / WeN5) TaxID=679901 RepID=F7XQ62_METZD|nr:archaellin/type IV pilin N-terminal domain-containing protein [Methanosalsum zhilinae]AEH60424.1 flagellin [Methanosalsum zhilinae DSM 4017]
MKANRNLHLKEDTSAQVGIGTLIIFIAMVLVAAVAAAVLIQTSGVLQQRAQQTGAEATHEVSSNLDVKHVEGIRGNDSSGDLTNTFDLLKLQLGLQAGSSPVDIKQLIITISDGRQTNTLEYTENTSNQWDDQLAYVMENNITERFTVQQIRDEDDSFTAEQPVMNTGDLINLYIGTATDQTDDLKRFNSKLETIDNSGLELDARTSVDIILTPEAGATSQVSFVTPSTYGVNEISRLYP